MKKASRIIPLLTLIVPLAACGGNDLPRSSSSSSSDSSSSSSSESSSSSSESSSSSSEDTRAKELLAYNNTNEVTTVVPSEKKTYDGYYQKGTETHYTIEHVRESGGDSQLPSLGKQRILVCPIDFTNWPAKNTDTEGTGEVFRRRLFNASFGDSDNVDVGFESVRSFYQTSSYGALQLE